LKVTNVEKLTKILDLDINDLNSFLEKNTNIKNNLNSNEFIEKLELIKNLSNLSINKFKYLFLSLINHFENPDSIINCEKELEKILDVSKDILVVSAIKNSAYYNEDFPKIIISTFDFLSNDELNKLIHSNKFIITSDFKAVVNNLTALKKIIPQNNSLSELLLKNPKIITLINLTDRINKLKTLFNLSKQEIGSFLVNYPNLLFVSITNIKETISYLSTEFYLSDFEIVCMIRNEPNVLLKSKEHIHSITRKLMKTFSISEAQIKDIILSYPKTLLLSEKDIYEKFENLSYSNLFVRLDIKNLVLSCPYILYEPLFILASNILLISKIFMLSEKKKISAFIRECPKTITSLNIKEKLVFLDQHGFSLATLIDFPKLLDYNQNLLAIKKIITEPFGIDYYLDELSQVDYDYLIKLIKFSKLENQKITFPVIHESDLQNVYKISLDEFNKKYSVSKKEMIKFTKIYSSNKHKQRLISLMFNSSFLNNLKILYNQSKNILNTTKLSNTCLQLLGIEPSFASRICENIKQYTCPTNIINIIEILINNGYTREDIINLIESKPTILSCQPQLLHKEIKENPHFNK